MRTIPSFVSFSYSFVYLLLRSRCLTRRIVIYIPILTLWAPKDLWFARIWISIVVSDWLKHCMPRNIYMQTTFCPWSIRLYFESLVNQPCFFLMLILYSARLLFKAGFSVAMHSSSEEKCVIIPCASLNLIGGSMKYTN